MSELTFQGRVAIVTGAGGGLGRTHAIALADRGARVVVNDVSNAQPGEKQSGGPSARAVVEEIREGGGEAVADTHSVATPDGGAGVVETALDAFGRVDVLVNNAGILRDRTFAKMTPDELDPVLDVHLRGSFFVTSRAWREMREQRYGRIVNTTSTAGLFGNFGQANYAAAKMGLVGLTHVLAEEGRKYGIQVNAIAPTARTRMTEDILGPLLDRLDPDLVSPVVVFLAHDSCELSGEIFSAGGGRVARIFVAETRGIHDQNLTAERVADRLEDIRDTDAPHLPTNAMEQIQLIADEFERVGAGT